MLSRLDRYEDFINFRYRNDFDKGHEYSVDEISPDLLRRMSEGVFTRIVFSGMGCSAIVSDVIRTYLTAANAGLEVYIFNDYEFTYLLPESVISDESTLFIISSYSGFSEEPVRVFHSLEGMHHRTLLLTSGGKLAALGRQHGVSIARWALSEPDREYPLFHVGQYFAILVDLFFRLGLIREDHNAEVKNLPTDLSVDFNSDMLERAHDAAVNAKDANIIMVASPKWYESLLKLGKMHFNEMAMAPATRNYFHEFCHSEVATLSDPSRKHHVMMFLDDDDDEYTRKKMKNLVRLLTQDIGQNINVSVTEYEMTEPSFMRKYFTALEFIQITALNLGRYYGTESRELISEAAGNPWYHGTAVRNDMQSIPAR